MSRSTGSMITGLALGAAAGIAISAVAGGAMSNKKAVKKQINRAIRTMGGFIDNVSSMVR